MAQYWLNLLEIDLPRSSDTFCLDAAVERMCFVSSGELTLTDDRLVQRVQAQDGCFTQGALELLAEVDTTCVWVWELTGAQPVVNSHGPITLKHTQEINVPDGERVMRLDKVDFPPGAAAHTHVHPGPGIRIVLKGKIGIQQGDAAIKWMSAGEPWFETGPDPVFAPTTEEEPTTFVRCMILPMEWRGKNTIRYLNPEDKDKPKLQQYHRFVDAIIDPA